MKLRRAAHKLRRQPWPDVEGRGMRAHGDRLPLKSSTLIDIWMSAEDAWPAARRG